MFPLSTVVFPDAELPLHVFEPRYRQLVADVLETTREFGTVLITAGSEVGGGDRRADVGTLVRVEMAMPLEDGRWLLATRGIERIRVTEWLDDDPYPRARVESFPSGTMPPDDPSLAQAAAAVRRVRMLLSELDDGPCCSIDLDLGDEPDSAAWMACALAPIAVLDAQALLEITDPVARLTALVERCCERIADLSQLLSEST
jgi:Lon protease-like protein